MISVQSVGERTFSGRWGAVLATAGVAIGLGNIWRFPYMMGLFGGAGFLLLYAFLLVFFGIPALMTEWAVGRSTRETALRAYSAAGLPGGMAAGVLILVTVCMAASYYGVILGWVLDYVVTYSLFSGSSSELEQTLGDFWSQAGGTALVLVISGVALYGGVRRGIERCSRWAMPIFFALMVILVIRVLTLEGAGEGLRYYLVPRWEDLSPATVMAALGQAFFSLGLGGSMMITYGSYLGPDVDLRVTAVGTALSDLSAALLAGLAVVPAVIVFGIPLSSGPPLMFSAMPAVFEQMIAGRWFGLLFFFSILLVGILSMMAAMEVIVSGLSDHWNWSRGRVILGLSVILMVLSVPAILSVNYITYSDLIWGTTMQPLGAALAMIAAGWCLGRSRMLREIGWDSGLLYFWVRYVLPAGIVAALIYGWAG